jgi:hypothetical protein
MKRDEDEKHIRELNEAAERDAELSRIKAQLWRRIAAAMTEIPRVPAHEPLCRNASTPVSRQRGGTG